MLGITLNPTEKTRLVETSYKIAVSYCFVIVNKFSEKTV
jgi:hypothetical protein